MYQRQRTRFSMMSEDENSLKLKQMEKNIHAKKENLKQEFDKLEEERKYDDIRAKTNREFEVGYSFIFFTFFPEKVPSFDSF
jgi:hypothetical protein